MIKKLFVSSAVLFAACGGPAEPEMAAPADEPKAEMAAPEAQSAPMLEGIDGVLAAQPEEVQARYAYRHPKETIEFFGIEPGMRVVEALPGGGWYSRILLAHLGNDGHLVGADYAMDMWPKFGFMTPERIEEKKTWVSDWTSEAQGWRGPRDADVSAFVFGEMPADLNGTADVVLFIRALHNLSRFENDGGFLTEALADAYAALKPGGVLGIVQHAVADSAPAESADGSRGYLRQDLLTQQVTAAGFEFVAASDVNANPLDQPADDEIVWRLPPSLVTSREDAELRTQMEAIGESNRMTLTFRKP
ncbi:MAG: methyltransferase [Pseudomonadota bacterium]